MAFDVLDIGHLKENPARIWYNVLYFVELAHSLLSSLEKSFCPSSFANVGGLYSTGFCNHRINLRIPFRGFIPSTRIIN